MATVLNKTTGRLEDDGKPAAIPTSGGTSGQAVAPTNKPAAAPGGGRFTNIQQYLTANSGAGERIANRLGEDIDKTNADVTKAVGDTGTIATQIEDERARIRGAGTLATQVAADPTKLTTIDPTTGKVVANNDFTSLFRNQNEGGNLGAASANALTTTRNKLTDLQGQTKQIGSEEGRQNLLRNAFGRPTYNAGQQRLDQMLLQTSGGGVLNDLQQKAATTAQKAAAGLTEAEGTLGTGLQKIGSEAMAAKEMLTKALGRMDDPLTLNIDESKVGGGAFGALQQDLRTRQAKYIEDQKTAQTNLQTELGGQVNLYKDQFTQKALDLLGLKEGQQLYNLDLKDIVKSSFSPDMVKEYSVATKDKDLPRYQALAALAGIDPSYLTSQNAGTAQGLQVNTQRIQDLIAEKKNEYDTLNTQYDGKTLPQRLAEPYKNAYYQSEYKPEYDKRYAEYLPLYKNSLVADQNAAEAANYTATKYAENQRSNQLIEFKRQLAELDKFTPNRTIGKRG